VSRPFQAATKPDKLSDVDIDGNNALQIKAIGVVISTFETLSSFDRQIDIEVAKKFFATK
jgi:hypothetical protein